MQASLIGNYADPRVAESVGRFLATLSENPEEIREGVLLMRFRSIEADAISYSDAESERDRAIRSLLMDLVSSAEDLISLYPAIRTMEAHRQALRFQTEERNLVLYRQHTTTLIELAKRSEVVSASVIDALSDGEKEIEALSTIVEAAHNETVRATAIERRAMVAGLQALDVRNFVVAPLSRLAEEFRPVAQESWRQVKVAIPKGLGRGVEEGLALSFKGGVVALIEHLAGPVAGLAALISAFVPLAQRSQSVREAVSEDEPTTSLEGQDSRPE